MPQPTLSRLENAPSWRELGRMGLLLIDPFCASFKAVPERIVHGGQQLALFDAHYDDTCFQPIHTFEAATGKPVLSLLRPGRRPSGEEAAEILKHVIRRIRRNWPRVEITLRGDGHHGTPEVMELLEGQGCGYIFGLSGNARPSKIGQPWCEDAAVRRVRQGKDRVRRFFQTGYQAKSWLRARKAVARVEAASKGPDIRLRHAYAAPLEPRPRLSVTNPSGEAKALYAKPYCARGQTENMIKEHKLYTKSDRSTYTLTRPPLGSQPVPALPAQRRLLAAAPAPPGRAAALAVAQGDVRSAPPRLPQDRRAHRGTQIPPARRPAFGLSISACPHVDGRPDRSPRPVNQAARAAR